MLELSQLPVFVFEDGRLTETYGMHLKGKPVIVELKEGSVSIKTSKSGGGTKSNSGDGVTSNYADNSHLNAGNIGNIYLASNHSASNNLVSNHAANNTSECGGYINLNHPLVIAVNDNTIPGLVRASGIDTVSSILSRGISTSDSANVGGRKSILVTQPAVSVNGVSVSLNGDEPKTVGDISSNLVRDFIAPHNIGKAQFANPSMMALSAMGEVSEYIQENVVYGINKLPGGEYVLSTIGSIVGPIVNTTHNILGGVGSLLLSDAQVEYLKQKYTDLPHGMQVLGRDILDIATLSAAGKVAGSTLKVMATPQEVVRNTKYINVTPDMLYKHPEPLKPHPKQAYVPPIVLTDVEYIDLTKPALMAPAEITLAQESILTENYMQNKIMEVIASSSNASELTEASALKIKVAWKALETQLGKIRAGADHPVPLRDSPRLASIYGGEACDWVKMKSPSIKIDKEAMILGGKKMRLHWYENIKTGQKIEHKPKIDN